MSFKCYFGRPHQRQVEEIAARILAREVRRCLAPDEWARLAFNVHLRDTHQADVLLFTSYAVIVADWKDMIGRVTGTDRGPWLRDGQPILAGSFRNENPYQQILNLRRSVSGFIHNGAARYLEGGEKRFDTLTYKQVGAAIIFTPAKVEYEIDLSSKEWSWFLITGLDMAAPDLMTRRSKLRLKPEEAEAYIEQDWRCQRWESLEATLPDLPLGTLWHARLDGTRVAHLITHSFSIGRDERSDWVLTGGESELERVSRRHVQVYVTGDEVVIYDAGSSNGTYLEAALAATHRTPQGHERVDINPVGPKNRLESGKPQVLRSGDSLSLGGPAGFPGTARLEFIGGQPRGPKVPTFRPAGPTKTDESISPANSTC